MLRAPLLYGRLIFAEHPFPGAGSVHQNPVKIRRKTLQKTFRRFVCNNCVCNPHAFYIFRQDFCPRRMDFIADKNPLSLHISRNLRAFSPGRSAQIQNPLPGKRPKILCGRHGAWLLDIIRARVMVRMFPGLVLGLIIITGFRPRNRRKGKLRLSQKIPGRRF